MLSAKARVLDSRLLAPEVSKTVQLEEPFRSNWPIYSALHFTVWGVYGFGVGVRSG